MATTGDFSGGKIAVGDVISRTFRVIRDNPVVILGSTFVVALVPAILFFVSIFMTVWSQAVWLDDIVPESSSFWTFVLLVVLGVVAAYVTVNALIQAAMVRVVLADDGGEKATLAACVMSSLRHVLPLLAVSVLLALACSVGILLLVVPAVIMTVVWSVVVPVLVVEGTGVFEAFGRSIALTKGNRWSILGLFLFSLILNWLVSAVVNSGTILFIPFVGVFLRPILTFLLYGFYMAYWGIMTSCLYVALRTAKEGPMTEHLAEVFA